MYTISFTLRRIGQFVCDKLPRPKFTYPSWLPGFLSYCESINVASRAFDHQSAILIRFPFPCSKVALLFINALLPFIAVITLDNITTGPQLHLLPPRCVFTKPKT